MKWKWRGTRQVSEAFKLQQGRKGASAPPSKNTGSPSPTSLSRLVLPNENSLLLNVAGAVHLIVTAPPPQSAAARPHCRMPGSSRDPTKPPHRLSFSRRVDQHLPRGQRKDAQAMRYVWDRHRAQISTSSTAGPRAKHLIVSCRWK